MSDSSELALGLDIGGTSTRAVVIDDEGNRRGTGRAPGGNITAHPPDRALHAVHAAIADAVSTVDPSRVRSAVIGAAGLQHWFEPETDSALRTMWRSMLPRCDFRIVPDAIVAFVAGTPRPEGTLLLSGTGALAAAISHGEITKVVDSHGWLLGDEGSAFDIGRQAVRTALRVLNQRETPGPLTEAVLRKALGQVVLTDETAGELILSIHENPPVELAEFAPLVSAHVTDDPAAKVIIENAAGTLISNVREIRAARATLPIVLAGGLLVQDTPLSVAVRQRISWLWPGAELGLARDGAAGAAWMAAEAMWRPAESLRSRLFSGAASTTGATDW